ncbi:hypothetical protein [Thermus oshimai]|uniref:hypothetical protein n=1 Tax=Thermus oshimai TaxID=56957 RepID=UPI00036D827E|nr:hypothetical protein [Thermus oshimai]
MSALRLLILLPLLLLPACLRLEGPKPPEDPEALAEWLGTFRIREFRYTNGDRYFFLELDPRDPNAVQAGILFNGYPYDPPDQYYPDLDTGGGVGRAWIKPFPQKEYIPDVDGYLRGFDIADGAFAASLHRGEMLFTVYGQIFGRWYRIEIPTEVSHRREDTHIKAVFKPARAYPLPDLPEIDPFSVLPPSYPVPLCAQPWSAHVDDPLGVRLTYVPWVREAMLNRIEMTLYASIYRNPLVQRSPSGGDRVFYTPRDGGFNLLSQALLAVSFTDDPDDWIYFDYFVRLGNRHPKIAHAYDLFWRFYNVRPWRVTRAPDGGWYCEGFEGENLKWEGPFTYEEFKARFFDPRLPVPDEPPERNGMRLWPAPGRP